MDVSAQALYIVAPLSSHTTFSTNSSQHVLNVQTGDEIKCIVYFLYTAMRKN